MFKGPRSAAEVAWDLELPPLFLYSEVAEFFHRISLKLIHAGLFQSQEKAL